MAELYDIYFNENKEAFAFEIENPICTIKSDLWGQYAGTDKWDIIDGVFTDISNTEEYKEKKRQEEAERVGNLQCTKRVFILMLEELQLDYFNQILPAIEANRSAKLEWELCVQLERKNPLIDQLASQFGITSEQLDILFKVANGELPIEDLRASLEE